ncbi:MAG: flagellar protein FlaG [bacterium]|jgi:flagellar protein FlaG
MNVDPISAVGRHAQAPVEAPAPAELAANRETIQAVHAVNGAELFGQNSELTFTFDRETRQPIIRLVDRRTNEVIRQIPPETVLRLSQALERGERPLVEVEA